MSFSQSPLSYLFWPLEKGWPAVRDLYCSKSCISKSNHYIKIFQFWPKYVTFSQKNFGSKARKWNKNKHFLVIFFLLESLEMKIGALISGSRRGDSVRCQFRFQKISKCLEMGPFVYFNLRILPQVQIISLYLFLPRETCLRSRLTSS